jgi:cytochrome c peroxidase
MTKLQIEQRLNVDTKYQQDFEKVYHKKTIDFDEVVDAIAEFEKTLITPNSKFDQFLKGKVKLTKDEQKGYLLFETFGCITCHNGMNIGGNSFQKIGIVIKYDNCYKDKFEVTKRKFDRCVYKVPTLRNIELTSPYFHDGSAKNLDEAIQKMSYHNLGFEIDNSEVQYIKAFLKTLTGTLQMDKE